jgi:hypothetical protein
LIEQAVKRLVLGDDVLVLIRAVVYLREVPKHVAYVAVGNDGAGIERSQQLVVDGLFVMQAMRLLSCLGYWASSSRIPLRAISNRSRRNLRCSAGTWRAIASPAPVGF